MGASLSSAEASPPFQARKSPVTSSMASALLYDAVAGVQKSVNFVSVRTAEFHLYLCGGKMSIPDYPTTLTNADWQKKKGLLAKMAGETGIGAALIKATTAHEAVDWAKIDVLNAYPNLQALEDAEKVAKEAFHAKVSHLIDELVKVRTLAQAVAKTFQQKKTIPASAVKAVTDVGAACTSYISELNRLE